MVFFLIITLGCSNKARDIEVTGDPLILEIRDLPEGDSSVIQSITYIPLETNDNCLIGNIEKVFYRNNRFYAIDKNVTKSIFVFDAGGKFLWKIDKRGKGPGEYTELLDFDVDSIGNIYLLDNGAMKIIKYDSLGALITEYKTGNRFMEFTILNDTKILVYNVFGEEKRNTKLGILDLKKRKLNPLISSNTVFDDPDVPMFRYYALCKSRKAILYAPRFSNKVYRINPKDGAVENAIAINGIPTPTEEYLLKAKKNRVILNNEFKYLYDVNCIFETDDILYLSYLTPSRLALAYNKKSGNYVNLHFQKFRGHFGSRMILGTTDSAFISLIPSSVVQQSGWIERINQSGLDGITKEKLLKLSADSNPMLVLTKFSDF
jgi:hypothetical protein